MSGIIRIGPEVGALHEVGARLYRGPPKTACSARMAAEEEDAAGAAASSASGASGRPRSGVRFAGTGCDGPAA